MYVSVGKMKLAVWVVVVVAVALGKGCQSTVAVAAVDASSTAHALHNYFNRKCLVWFMYYDG